jgi:CheY-like chemotaxis protein
MARLLIVEDDETTLRGLEALFGMAGHDVRAVTSGEAALETIKTALPQLIIADILLPGMSGLQLWEAMRSQPRLEDIPFLFVTARDARKTEEQIAAVGATPAPLFRKPFDPEGLLEAVATELEAH